MIDYRLLLQIQTIRSRLSPRDFEIPAPLFFPLLAPGLESGESESESEEPELKSPESQQLEPD